MTSKIQASSAAGDTGANEQVREADLRYPATYRPYQAECLDIIHQKQLEAEQKAAEGKGPGRYLVVLATGLGKTYIFTHMDRRGGRTLILSHRDELVRQPQKYFNGVSFGVEKADERAAGEEIVSASVMTLCRDSRLQAFKRDEFKTIIVDEAHHASAKSYQKILKYFSGAEMIIGFTATGKRGDGVALSTAFDEIIFYRDLRWGIRNGYLSRVRGYEVKASYNLANVEKTAGDYNQGQLETALMTGDSVAVTAKAYMDFCHKKGKHTLIYCVTKEISISVLKTIYSLMDKDERKKVRALFGDTPADERAAILKGFADGEIMCIVNCMVLTEGTDLPVCDAIINMRPTCNDALYQQIVGRGTRLYEDKDFCTVLDIVPLQARSHNLCTAPTLFGIDPNALTEKQRDTVCSLDNDLLEVCDSLAGHISTARSIEVELNAVNSILDEVQEMLDSAKNHTIQEFAINYLKAQEKKWTHADQNYNFGSLAVTIRADYRHRFSVKPTWDERIYISSPDILDNTSVELHVFGSFCKLPKEVIAFTGVCSLDEAIRIAKMYCMIQSHAFDHCWDRRVKTLWANQRCTEKQAFVLEQASFFRDRGIDTSNPSVLSKLEASEMIDLMRTSSVAEKELKKLENDNRENLLNLSEDKTLLDRPEMRRFRTEQEVFDAFVKATKKAFEKTGRSLDEESSVSLLPSAPTVYAPPAADVQQEISQSDESPKEEIVFMVESSSKKMGYATPRQYQLIASLVSHATSLGIQTDVPERNDLSYKEAHALISILSYLIVQACESPKRSMQFAGVPDMIQTIANAPDGWHSHSFSHQQ